MFLYATDFDRTQRIVIDAYSHVNWEPSFDDEGVFEMVVPKSVAKKLKHDMVVENSEDSYNQAIIQYNDFDTNEGIDSFVTVKGYFLSKKLKERVCLGVFEFEEDTLENIMNKLIETSVLPPRDFGRSLNVVYSSEDLKSITLSFENRYGDLFNNLKRICQSLDLGFKLILEQDCSFTLHIYEGIDLSNDVRLSMELDTSTAMMYYKDSSGEANIVYAMGDDDTIIEEVDLELNLDWNEDGYVELEYIESTGTQHIDFELKPNQDTRLVLDFEILSGNTAESHICSARTNGGTPLLTLYFSANGSYGTRYGTSAVQTISGLSGIGRHVFERNKNVCTIDGQFSVTASIQTFVVNTNLTLFCRNEGTTTNAYIKGRSYSCQVYEDGINLSADCIPVKRKDGVVCLFDKARRKYLENKGTGAFIAGPIKGSKVKRKETFLNISDVKRGDLSESAYRAILRSKVLEQKESFRATENVESSLSPQNRIKYGEHFLIGDIITQEFKDFGVESVSRVTGVSQMWSLDGYTVAIISSNVKKKRR